MKYVIAILSAVLVLWCIRGVRYAIKLPAPEPPPITIETSAADCTAEFLRGAECGAGAVVEQFNAGQTRMDLNQVLERAKQLGGVK